MNRDACVVDLAVFNAHDIQHDFGKESLFDPAYLNAMLAHGGKKCIVLISEHVLSAYDPFTLVGVDKFASGLKLLRNLVEHAEKNNCLLRIKPEPEPEAKEKFPFTY